MVMFHFQLSARPKPKQWKRHNGGWILDIIVRNHIVAFRLQCSPPASSLLPSWPLMLFYCIYFCINLSSLLPLLCLLSHFTRASPVPCIQFVLPWAKRYNAFAFRRTLFFAFIFMHKSNYLTNDWPASLLNLIGSDWRTLLAKATIHTNSRWYLE